MDRINLSFVKTSLLASEVVPFGELDSCAVDQSPSKEFNIDPTTGRPISDITCILRAKGLEKQQLLADLPQNEATYLPDDANEDDVLSELPDRNAQLPSELAEHTERITSRRLEQAERKRLNEERVKREKEDADLLASLSNKDDNDNVIKSD